MSFWAWRVLPNRGLAREWLSETMFPTWQKGEVAILCLMIPHLSSVDATQNFLLCCVRGDYDRALYVSQYIVWILECLTFNILPLGRIICLFALIESFVCLQLWRVF
jgi:hypothetical protein